jgi:hypothetical protein
MKRKAFKKLKCGYECIIDRRTKTFFTLKTWSRKIKSQVIETLIFKLSKDLKGPRDPRGLS